MGLANITNNILTDSGILVTNLTPTSRTLTINGVTYDLSADRSWSIATHDAVTIGTANGLSLSGQVLSLALASGSTTGALSSTDWTTFNNKQAAGNYITSLTGEATGTGPGATSVTLNNASVTAKILTGVNITGGSISATDSILTAFGKVQNQINGLIGSTIYQGTWNASTNTPALTSGVGTRGYYYIVSVAGNTNLDGITDWNLGDWAIFDGTAWQQVDNTDAVVSVNGQTGAVSLTTDNISEGATNQYFLNSRARAALSFTAGSGAYNSTTGVITIPTNTSQLTNGANFITLASLSGTAPIQYNNSTGVISITQAGTASNGYLSSTDWNTFNNKQNALTNPVTGTGTTNYLPKFTGTSTIGNSLVYDDGTRVFINATTAPGFGSPKFFVKMATVNSYEGILVSSSSNNNAIAIAHTGSLGLITTNYGTSGANTPLAFGTNGAEQMRLDTSGNLGLGVTPSAWASLTALQVGNSSLSTYLTEMHLSANAYYNSGWKYVGTGFGARYSMNDAAGGAHAWFTAPSGTAGNAISFTQAMTLDASGRLGIGTTSPSTKLDISGSHVSSIGLLRLNSSDGTLSAQTFYINSVYKAAIFADTSNDFNIWGREGATIFSTGTTITERMRITSGGNVLIGTTTDSGYKLDVNGTGRFASALTVTNGNIQFDTSENVLKWNSGNGVIEWGSAGTLYLRPTGAASNSLTIASTGAATFSSTIRSNATNGFGIGSISGYRRIQYDLANTRFGLLTDGNALANFEAASATLSGDLTLTSTGGHTINMVATTAGSQTISMTALGGGSNTITGTGGDLNIQTTGAYPLVFKVNSVENLRIATGESKFSTNMLNVYAETSTLRISGNGISANRNYGTLEFYNLDGSQAGPNVAAAIRAYSVNSDGSGGYLTFNTSLGTEAEGTPATERMRITSGGNVLIGTTTDAGYKLDVSGTGRFVNASTFQGIFSGWSTTGANSASGAISLGNTAAYRGVISYAADGDTILSFDNSYDSAGAIMRFRMRTAGTAINALSIAGTGAATFSSSVTATRLIVGQSIGLSGNLEVYSSSYGNLAAFRSIPNDGINSYFLITSSASGITLEENGSSYKDLMFKTGGSERMRITSGGNVLIGTTTDAGYKLDVNGNVRIQGQILGTSVANNWLQSTQSGTSAQFQTWYASNGTTRRGYFGYGSGGSDNFTLMNEANGQLTIGTNSISALIIASTGAATFSSSVTANGNILISSVANPIFYSQSTTGTSGSTVGTIRFDATHTPSGTIYTGPSITAVKEDASYATALVFKNTASDGSNNAVMRITSGGNVGIGTSSPTTFSGFLTVEQNNASGNSIHLVTGTSVIYQTIASNTNSAVYIGSRSNHPLLFTTNDTERMRITSSGNVGIGTSSPSVPLDVQSNSNASAIRIRGRSADDIAEVDFYNYANNSLMARIQADTGYLLFDTGGTERMRITSGGNVGINTTSPSYLLDVVSNQNASTILSVGNTTSNTAAYSAMRIGSSQVVWLYNFSDAYTTSGRFAAGTFLIDASSLNGININSVNSIIALSTSNTERMRITSGGDVGIGVTAPVYKLEVNNSTGDDHIAAVGTAPSLQLMSANSGPANWATIGMATTTNNFITGSVAGDFCIANRGTTAGNMLFGFSSTEKMRLTSNGDLLVNATATTQGAKLYVNGTAAFGSVYVASLGTGTVYSNAGTLTNTNPSDYRLKNTIKPLTYGLNEVLQLNPKTFYYNDDATRARLKYGFIAQEVKEVMPDMVRLLGNEDYLGLEQDGIWVTLVNAIKEQQAQIEQLKSQLNK